MKEVAIVSGCRTPIGAFGGSFRDLNASNLASIVMKESILRSKIEPNLIDDIRFGCCLEPPESLNVARVGALLAKIPDKVTAVTINRVCVSGMEAVISGMAMIQAEMAEIILAGGVEHMSGVAYHVPNARWGCRLHDKTFVDSMIRALHCGSHILPNPEEGPVDSSKPPLSYFKGKPYLMGHTAEFVAQHLNISRKEMDEIALRSNNKAERANIDGSFNNEIVPVKIYKSKNKTLTVSKDEHFRKGLTIEDLEKLPPAFVPKIGKITAGNSSGINDGASAMIIMSLKKAKEMNAKPIAKIIATGRGACHPSIMGLSPVPAVNDLIKKKGFKIRDFELIELNEAFAAQYIGCERELCLDRTITNVNGSGIGLGHPVGSTGSRIIITLINAMINRNKSLGLATICGGGGISMACAIEIL